ncbi:L-threonylcarbamoyladenylate synthase [Thermodesulfobacteriota bacterium]
MEGLADRRQIVKVDAGDNLKAGLKKAKKVLISGGIVAFPTESFYGLAVNAMNEEAIQRLFVIKKRRSDRPLLILIPSPEVLNQYVNHIPEIGYKLIKQFWPGGLTLLFEAGPNIPPLLTAHTGKIGIRMSSHPIATALSQSIGLPITGTSANISGEQASMKAEDVSGSLGNGVDLILDGGDTAGGKGSTILDVTVNPPKILREGMIRHEKLLTG